MDDLRRQVAELIDGMIYCHQWHNCRFGHCKMRKCRIKEDDKRIDLVIETMKNYNLTLDDFARILEAYRRYFTKQKEQEGSLIYQIKKICESFDMEEAMLGKLSAKRCPSE